MRDNGNMTQADANQTTTTKQQGETCGAPLSAHIKALLVAMDGVGLGGDCIDTYRALAELAEFIRRSHSYPVYQTQDAIDQILAEERLLSNEVASGRRPSGWN